MKELPLSSRGVSRPFVLPLLSLPLLLSCNALEICPISHFNGALRHFLLSRVGLLGLGALR